jgi:hypothetical protein
MEDRAATIHNIIVSILSNVLLGGARSGQDAVQFMNSGQLIITERRESCGKHIVYDRCHRNGLLTVLAHNLSNMGRLQGILESEGRFLEKNFDHIWIWGSRKDKVLQGEDIKTHIKL